MNVMPRLAALAAAAFACALAATPARAGVVIHFETKAAGDAAPRPATLWIEADRLRVESSEGTMIYRDDKRVLWVMEGDKKSYMEMTEKDAEKVSGAMSEMQAQLAALPPEQRAMVEQMMKGQMASMGSPSAAPREPLAYAKTGKSETINGWACTSWDATRGGRREQELWVTGFTDFGLKESDFAACQRLAEFLAKMGGPIAEQVGDQPFARKLGGGADALPGVPVRTIDLDPRGATTHELKKVAREEIPSSKFDLPAGYAKQDLGL